LLHHISQTHGVPLALYADRHTIFQSPKQATIAEQLVGKEPRSHLGRMLDRVDIQLIAARSPQAKGRVERLFGTFQDRLVKELRRSGAGTLAEANKILRAYLPRFNSRFMKPPAQSDSAYRPPLTQAQANDTFCFTYGRTVAADHTISVSGHTIQLSIPTRYKLAGQRIELRHRMDGRLAVFYKGQKLTMIQPAELGPPQLDVFIPAERELAGQPAQNATKETAAPPAAPKKPKQNKPAADHPWRRDKKLELEQKEWRLKQKQKGPG
jgi:hypothetical protein